jgi:DeoR/GlpR family transcriptional regulator of sugar metabolism
VLLTLHAAGDHTVAELAELFSVSRATVDRELARPKHEPKSDRSDRAPVR